MTYGTNPAALNKLAFECPHCGAYTSQRWFNCFAQALGDGKHPNFPDKGTQARLRASREMDDRLRDRLIAWADRMHQRVPFFTKYQDGRYLYLDVENLSLSECFVCRKLSVWVADSVVAPGVRQGPAPNPDMPEHIKADYEEARSIVHTSARGAAALLRLCVQKLCDHLGEQGKTIDDAIASLVAKGLSPVVQQALDTVRVIGNESVHPGQIDLRDDPETAMELFKLVNIIVTRMISDQKQVDEIYQMLPPEKRAAIEARNTRALEQPKKA